MRVGVVADLHIGNHQLFKNRSVAGINSRCAAAIQTLRVMYALAAEQGVETLYIAGDVFDTSSPSPQIVAAVMDVIAEAAPRIETVILKGNHDSNSPNPGDHALGPLAHVCSIATDPIVVAQGRILLLPFRPHPTEWLRDMFDSSIKPGMIVLSHFGIADAGTPLYMKHGGVPIELVHEICEEYRIGAWLSGDWHSHKRFPAPRRSLLSGADATCSIQQIGALCPTGFDNPGGDALYGSLLVVQAEMGLEPWVGVERVVVPGPRFYYSPDEPGFSPLTFIKLRVAQAYREDEMKAAVEAGELGGYVLALDTETGEAATGAKVADEFADAEVSGIDEALDAYVDKMPGLDPNTRSAVKDLCRGYLQKQNTH